MANTVYGPYGKTTWVDHVTLGSQNLMNNLETQASVALNGLNGDFWSSHVRSGVTPSIDGTLANQLDITSGTVYLRMNDNSLARCVVAATNFTTSTPSTTYYLDLNPDGSWSWGTAHSGVANHFPIAQCTTDGSGNIATLTDNRGPSGQPGVPIIVARALGVAVTATADQQILSYAPPVEGIYRASMTITYRNATPQKVIARLDWGNPTLGNLVTNYFRDGWDNQWLNGAQANVAGNNQGLACEPLTVHAVSKPPVFLNIVIHFQDPGGAPNDVVSAVIERLA